MLASFLVADALIAELVGVKVFALKKTLGAHPFDWRSMTPVIYLRRGIRAYL